MTVAQVRTARAEDEHALTELEAVAWSAASGFPSVIGAVRASGFFSAENPPHVHLVAELGGRVSGYLRLTAATRLPENAHVLQVNGIAVRPECRRRGVGSLLLQAAEARARAAGARKLALRVLSSNDPAIRLYERHGFTREGVLVSEFLINGAYVDDVLMAKHLRPSAPGRLG
jgi:ribosomal protein S18 acetylase RimI-like enzyme